jgi:flagellin-specific chaperone FliS
MSEKVGSFNDFLRENNIESNADSFDKYLDVLKALRVQLAMERGVTLEQLHYDTKNVS